MLTVFLFLNLSFKDFSLTVLVPVIDDKNKMKLNTVENRKKVHEIEQIEIEGEVLPGWAVDEATKLNRK